MTGIEKTVTNRSGAGVLVLCAILFGLCACTEDASYTAGVWYGSVPSRIGFIPVFACFVCSVVKISFRIDLNLL